MAKFKKIPAAQAPKPPRQSGRLANRMRQYEDHVASLKDGEVGMLEPEDGETARGIALRVGRAARRVNKSANTWMVDGKVYFTIS
jgi:hypothetical protein